MTDIDFFDQSFGFCGLYTVSLFFSFIYIRRLCSFSIARRKQVAWQYSLYTPQ
jgi:hypothetical protein